MACIRRRRNRWVVDWLKHTGRRGWKSFQVEQAAKEFLAERLRESGRSLVRVDPDVRLDAYAMDWLTTACGHLRESSVENYRGVITRWIAPAIGAERVTHITRFTVRAFLKGVQQARSLHSGEPVAPNTVLRVSAVLSMILGAAVEDGLLLTNPVPLAAKGMRLGSSRNTSEEVTAMDGGQLTKCLAVAGACEPASFPLLFLMSRTGLRIGEATGLTWNMVDTINRKMVVGASYSHGRMGPTKSGRTRRIDMPATVATMLDRMRSKQAVVALEGPQWVFPYTVDRPLPTERTQAAFRRLIAKTGLPVQFTPHTLRHTFAKLVLEAKPEAILYLQRHLGHANIGMTVDLYGKWAMIEQPGLLDRLDAPRKGSDVAGLLQKARELAEQSIELVVGAVPPDSNETEPRG